MIARLLSKVLEPRLCWGPIASTADRTGSKPYKVADPPRWNYTTRPNKPNEMWDVLIVLNMQVFIPNLLGKPAFL